MTRRDVSIIDSDILAIRRASRIVGTRLALVCTAVVALALLAVFLYILSEISAAELFETVPDTDNLQVSAVAKKSPPAGGLITKEALLTNA